MAFTQEKDIFIMQVSTRDGECSVNVQIKNSSMSRNFKLWVTDSQNAVLSKPKGASRKSAIQFLEKCKDWLVVQIEKSQPVQTIADYLQKNQKIYAGALCYKLYFQEAKAGEFYVEDAQRGELVFAFDSNEKDKSIERLFFNFARPKLAEFVDSVATRTEIEYTKITIRNQRGRWGSRSSSGTLSFNWRLALLPTILQEYVICHELAHVKFMDHSVSFWIYLNRLCPNAKRLDSQLSKEGKEIFSITSSV